LYGANINEVFLIWTGIGRNGKGLIDTMLRKTLGNFYYNLPVEELTEDSKGKGRASSELASSKWARCVMSTEPEAGTSKLKIGKIKQLTGKDVITTRELHKSVFSFIPNFVLSLQCNEIPVLSKVDDAISKRMTIMEFPHQFVENVLYDYQRQIDKSLKEKIESPEYRDGLLYLLLDAWKVNKGIIKEKDSMVKEEVLFRSNPLFEFLSSYEADSKSILFSELYNEYQKNYSALSKKDFFGYLKLVPFEKKFDDSHGHKLFVKKR
jgi:phage/plasmid-associated DNA primase